MLSLRSMTTVRLPQALKPLFWDYPAAKLSWRTGHKGLAYFDDAENERMPAMLWDVDWKTIKRTIQGWLKLKANTV